jgi:toxin YoeB
MRIIFSENAWVEYHSLQKENKKIVNEINRLKKEIARNPTEGIGKPEALKFDLSGY